VLEVIRGLLDELGSQGALRCSTRRRSSTAIWVSAAWNVVNFWRGWRRHFGMRLPDRRGFRGQLPEDLVRAILSAPGTTAEDEEAGSALRASVTVQKAASRGHR